MYSLERENRINLAVDLLLNDYSFISTPQQFNTQDNFYIYNDQTNVYELNAELFIVDKLDELFPNTFKHFKHIKDVITRIQKNAAIRQPDPNLVAYNNGIYDKRQNKLIPHSKKHFTINKLNLNYVEPTKPLNADKYAYLNYVD
jgi:phage/plasmid-associated DNA primase